MNATQYLTVKDAEFQKIPVFPSAKLSGIKTFRRTDKILNDSFLGCGVAITGSSCYNLAKMSRSDRETLIRGIYGDDGLGLSVARLTIASSDYSAELYSYDEVEGDTDLKHFSIERDMAYVIPMIKEILKVRPDLYIFASPWSPPSWMKTGGSFGGGYMRREYIDCYAEYIVRYVKEYAKCGIKISALTPQNEVETDQGGKMPACIWHPDIEAEFAVKLRQKLDENGLDVKIWIHDHNFSGWKRVKWMLDTHKELYDSCDGVAFHYYDGSIEDTLALKQAYPKLNFNFTEGGPRLYDNYGTDWGKWGIMLSKALNCGYKSFTGWNLMLDQYGGPNVGPFFCGGLVTRNNQTEALSYSGQYKAFSHVSRFMKKNAVVYELEQDENHMAMFAFPPSRYIPIQASCIDNGDGNLCYIFVNANTAKEQIQLYENGQWHYAELLPESISTIVFEK